MNDFTLLSKDEILGENHLDIVDIAGVRSKLTDYAIFLGAHPTPTDYGNYWTKTVDRGTTFAFMIDYEERVKMLSKYWRINSARVVYNVPKNIEEQLIKKFKFDSKTIFKVKYGYYPQKAVFSEFKEILDKAYEDGLMVKTGNYYTADSVSSDNVENKFLPRTNEEYIFENGRYVRTLTNACFDNQTKEHWLHGKKYSNGEYMWVRVQPISWFLDINKHIMLSERLLFSGVQFFDVANCNVFKDARLYKYLNTCFARELTQGLSEELLPIKDSIKDTKFSGLYNFDFSKVSEEDIIKGAIQSNVSVFLHGRSSDGKSSRVKQLDPDCTIIYLRNATPDSLNGKSVYNASTGEMLDVPPTWYKKLQEKCEKEPNKLHIVFFDELYNALPSIQGMAFNIILDGEVNGIWKLPENARIVAAGNDLDDSLAANEMAEPLFNRFAHVYIDTTVDDWLDWAMTPDKNNEALDYQKQENSFKIHPAIYAYIAYNDAISKYVLRTRYDGKKPNADPRKWEMASKVLYKTGKPEMLRALIGEDLTRDFIAFCTQRVISIEDVLKENYTEEDLQMDTSKKYITIVNLSLVDEENIEVIRDFVSKLGKELLATFDLLWTHGDEARLEKIAELKLKGQNKKLNITLN